MSNNYDSNIPSEYRPISTWGYIGYSILFCIPIVGIILTIVWAIGAKNFNLRNFARSRLIIIIISIAILVVGIVLGITNGVIEEVFNSFKMVSEAL